ncbi:hypothetical protein J4230_02120 [Candidatus Woesearchaeota archaeon]|nr:hypothetical protein [Candidatus Woesearchaeota archaeon]
MSKIILEVDPDLVDQTDIFNDRFKEIFRLLYQSKERREFTDYKNLEALLVELSSLDGRREKELLFSLAEITIQPIILPYTITEAKLYYHANPFRPSRALKYTTCEILIRRGKPTVVISLVKYLE